MIRIIASIFLTLILTGCMQPPRDIPKLSLQTRTKILTNLQHWQLSGKAAVRDKNQGHNVSVEWQQNQQQYKLRFFSPFTTDTATLVGQPGHVRLTTADGKNYVAANAEHLVFEHLGWNMPVASLVYWIKGMPTPHSVPQIRKLDQYNQLQTLRQDGWLIEYQSYTAVSNITLPEKLTLTNGQFKVKIVINNWLLM